MDNQRGSLKVLLVCDDVDTGSVWSYQLRKNGLDVFVADSPSGAIKRKDEDSPDLIIIDENSPELDGIMLCQKFRKDLASPILLLTQNTSEAYIINAYKAGADECQVKPVSPGIFIAKVRAFLRRARTMPIAELQQLEAGELRLEPENRILTVNNSDSKKQIRLSNLEFRLVYLFMRNPGLTHKTEDIILSVWGYGEEGDPALLQHLVFRIRRKMQFSLGVQGYIQSIPGVGYRFNTSNNVPDLNTSISFNL